MRNGTTKGRVKRRYSSATRRLDQQNTYGSQHPVEMHSVAHFLLVRQRESVVQPGRQRPRQRRRATAVEIAASFHQIFVRCVAHDGLVRCWVGDALVLLVCVSGVYGMAAKWACFSFAEQVVCQCDRRVDNFLDSEILLLRT